MNKAGVIACLPLRARMNPMVPLLADVGRRPCCAVGLPRAFPVWFGFCGCRRLVSSAEGSSPGGVPLSRRSAFGPLGLAGGCGAGFPLICAAGTRLRQVGFSRGTFLRRDNIHGFRRGCFGGERYALPKPAVYRFSLCRVGSLAGSAPAALDRKGLFQWFGMRPVMVRGSAPRHAVSGVMAEFGISTDTGD